MQKRVCVCVLPLIAPIVCLPVVPAAAKVPPSSPLPLCDRIHRVVAQPWPPLCQIACRECRQSQIENVIFLVFPVWIWVCFLGQLSQFARVLLYPLLHLFDERVCRVEVRRRRSQCRPVQTSRPLPPVRCSEPIMQCNPKDA